MNKKRYPLHHEDARPMYVSVPKDEWERMQARVKELENSVATWKKISDDLAASRIIDAQTKETRK